MTEIDQLLRTFAHPTLLAHRLHVLDTLIAYLHGPHLPDHGLTLPPSAARLPIPLRHYYQRHGKRRILSGQNHLLMPEELEEQDGKVTFWIENQGVYSWATTLSDASRGSPTLWPLPPEEDDPPVWGQFNGDEPWQLEEVKLSEFLIQACLFEGIMRSDCGAGAAAIDHPTVSKLEEVIRPLPLGP